MGAASSKPNEPETVQVLVGSSPIKRWKWNPVVGEETLGLLKHFGLVEDSENRVRDEALEILAQCAPPAASSGFETGLAVGYVQSGKTMSFTTVAALARDNGYRVVIVIAGTSTSLLAQSTARLIKDLRIEERNRGWKVFESRLLSARTLQSQREQLKAVLNAWTGAVPVPLPWMKQTALIVVMKHYKHLEQTKDLLKGLELRGVPALVIDDEADQASLNAAVRQNKETPTYSQIRQLRQCLPHHTFLQYTATPQAPLLLNIIDSLSPNFVEVLTPGPAYVGGADFFLKHASTHVRPIPTEELPGVEPAEEAPASLLEAMRLFFVGAAAGLAAKEPESNRSMMVHPSQMTVGHSDYYSWVMSAKQEWARLLSAGPAYAEDRKELLQEFKTAYNDIKATHEGLPHLDDVFRVLPWVVDNTVVQVVNARAGETPNVNWKANYSHILVGGQAMDRGFTVEGLTVTYMPRGLGVGNADTVQQRARFFGYKRGYFGYCRVFLESGSIAAYKKIVAHEEDVRRRLIAHRQTGLPLSAWKRVFFLDKTLRPTRSSVLELNYFRSTSAVKDWLTPSKPHFGYGEAGDPVPENRAAVARFRELVGAAWKEDDGHKDRTDYQVHLVARVPLATVLSECLLRLRFLDDEDAREYTVLQLLLAEIVDRAPATEALVYDMSAGKERERGLGDDGIKNLYQGAAPVSPKHAVGSIYPGDRKIVSETLPTIQIHTLRVQQDGARAQTFTKVPTVAIHLPSGVVEDMLVQPQANQP